MTQNDTKPHTHNHGLLEVTTSKIFETQPISFSVPGDHEQADLQPMVCPRTKFRFITNIECCMSFERARNGGFSRDIDRFRKFLRKSSGVEHASGYGLGGTSSNLWVDVEHAANKKSVRFEEKSPPEVLPYILYFIIQSKCRDNLRATIIACLTS